MQKAALYARVSTDAQKQEGTIESQVAELKRQIAAAGHVLVKEYLDDGFSGTYLDRPALDELRTDLKTDTFDVVYFLCPDRIARDVIYQDIIISELLKHKKRIVISGKDYEENPENKFALSVLGAAAVFERAKILERMQRGRLHRLRSGQLAGNGFQAYGYNYVRKTATQPPALTINEGEAAVVRSIFEMYVSGQALAAISRSLEKRGIPTRKGSLLWNTDHIRCMLKNETYTGIRYCNRMTHVGESSGIGTRPKGSKLVYRDRAEWIAVRVPAIISQELFDKAQERLQLSATRYCQPPVRYLLGGLVRCGQCARLYMSYRWYDKLVDRAGKVSVSHRAAYRCNTVKSQGTHDPAHVKPCRNSRVSTHILDSKVVEMLQRVMFDPEELAKRMETYDHADNQSIARELTKIAIEINGLDQERRRLIERYATEQITAWEYIEASQALDFELEGLTRRKSHVVKDMQSDIVTASIRHFCAIARVRFEACADFDAKKQFLRDHVEEIVFDRGRITIVGSVPMQGTPNETKLAFRIEGEIDRWSVRSQASRRLWKEDERLSTWVPAAVPNNSI